MKDIILKIENVSKQYRLGTVGTGTINDDLKRWWYSLRGKEDPFLKVGDINDRTQIGDSKYVWALKDISFELKRGEVLAIIGSNGAGKSTLLKILSKVTGPTTGSIKSRGRIASLLEVGTGFHPELTGRENIFLNGAILGMTKKEIASKLDEIIDFSGCEKYIDTPTKRYSSGMTVRLAFAVAAFLEPDILIIDEVLAVGDKEFQKKAIGKMQDISYGEGRTVLFVSHNMNAVESLCQNGIVLESGNIVFKGTAKESVDFYLKNNNVETSQYLKFDDFGNDFVKINSISINKSKEKIFIGDDLEIEVDFTILNETNKRIDISTAIYSEKEQLIFNVGTGFSNESPILNKVDSSQKLTLKIERPNLNVGLYNILLRVVENRSGNAKFRAAEIITFEVKSDLDSDVFIVTNGVIQPKVQVKIQ
jgi:lipopolysaccharide transport system ATP-binding protein